MSFSADVDINVNVDVDAVAGVAGDIASNAKIIPIMPPDIPIIFSYNPEKITLTRKLYTEKRTGRGDKRGSNPSPAPTPLERWKGTNSTQIKFIGYLEGPQTRAMAEGLLSLMSPGGGLLAMIAGLLGGPPLAANLPMVMFMWGSFVIPQAYIETCSVDYERFHLSGLPLRAKCTIGLKEIPSSLPLTNPTSGGLPGRVQHVVVAGESLPQLATRRYGAPARWRDVAAANGIDDPFAVRPGDNLFLPSPNELTSGTRQ